MKSRHLNTFLQFRLLFHKPHCSCSKGCFSENAKMTKTNRQTDRQTETDKLVIGT